MSRFKIVLTSNNAVFQVDEKDTENLEDFSLTIRREDEETNDLAFSFSSDLSFYGAAYNFIKHELIDPGFRNSIMKVDIYDTCCTDGTAPIFRGKITQDALEWCFDDRGEQCKVTINAIEHNAETEGYDCIASTIISTDAYWYVPGNPNPVASFWTINHPFIRYCIEARPAFLTHVTMFFIGVIGSIIDILIAIALLIVQLFSLVLIIFTAGQVDLSGELDAISNLVELAGKLLVGCGKGQISPYVRDYINNVCQICGQEAGHHISFKSSILRDPDGPYYNMVLFNAPVYDGSFEYDDVHRRDYWSNNRPLDTGKQFLDKLAKIFNAKWWYDGNTLHFEPENTSAIPIWMDFTALPEGKLVELCYKYSSDSPDLYARYQYQTDALDLCGNEARTWFNDIVSYVNPSQPKGVRSGEDLKTFDFGIPRFRNDGVSQDNLTLWIEFPLTILLLAAGGVRLALINYRDVLMLSTGQTTIPKLLIIDPVTWKPERKSRTAIGFHSNPIGGGEYYYQTDMWFAERWEDKPAYVSNNFNAVPIPTLESLYQVLNKPLEVPNLYTRFWEKDNPKKIDPTGSGSTKLGIEYTAEIIYECDDLIDLHQKPYAHVMTPYGKGNIKEITVKENVMTIRGRIVGT